MNRLAGWIAGPEGISAHIAHRLTQPRRRRKVIPIQLRSVSSVPALFSQRDPAIAWTHEPKRLTTNSELLFPELANDEIRSDHVGMQRIPTGLGIAALRDVFVSGPSLVGRSWLLYRLGPLAPQYVDDYLGSGINVGDRKVTRKIRRSVPGVSVLVTHWNANVYGHWLLECMPKLLLLRRLADQLPAFRILLPRSIRGWVATWIRLILPDAVIETYDDAAEYLACEVLLMPTLLSDPLHAFHPDSAPMFAELSPAERPRGERGRRLYVSRSEPSVYRELTNQAEIEAVASQEGLEIVLPETLSIEDQIALFASAELVVGEFGSAMHNTIFSPAGTKVFCLNWINGVQSRIAQLRRHRVGYLLPNGGVPVKFVEGAPRQSYHIDPRQFRGCLEALG